MKFFCPGRPRTKGSTRSFASRSTGRIVTVGDNPKTKAWQGVVAHAAHAGGEVIRRGGVVVEIEFLFARPKSHFGTGRNSERLKASSPAFPETRSVGDVDKLIRAVFDGLDGVSFRDDSQVIMVTGAKRWLDDHEACEGAWVDVRQL